MISEAKALKLASKVLDASDSGAMSRIADLLRVSKDNFRLQLGLAFEAHLSATYKRFAYIHTILTKDKLVELEKIYVPLRLKSDEEIVDDHSLIDHIPFNAKVLIEGTGGAGKSMLLRHLALRSIANPTGRIPIFAELRSLSYDNNKTFEDILFDDINQQGSQENHYTFLKALSEGLVILFLDGLDEVPTNVREAALEKINSFSARHSRLCVIISSRPGNSRHSLNLYETYNVLQLNLDQAISVVQRSSADKTQKESFVAKLRSGLYDDHQTFLGIPLLVVMMLLTYSRYSDIPNRMSVFYEQAFSTLYALHDSASKGPYKRQHYSELAPDEFRKIFENFCYITLSREKYQFLYHEAIEFLRKSLDYSQIDTTPEKYLQDLEESVCLMIKDGVDFTFSHRSFQEHFASKFAISYSGDNQFKVIENILGNDFQHNTITLMQEIDSHKLRQSWTVPALNELHETMTRYLSKPIHERIGLFFSGFEIISPSEPNGEIAHELTIGYPAVEGLTQSKVRQLAISLSRITKLPTPFNALSIPTDLVSNRTKFKSIIESLEKNNRNLDRVFNILYAEQLSEVHDNEQYSGRMHDLLINDESEEWLTKLGADQRFSDYLQHVSSVKRREEELLERQKEREMDLF